MKVISHVHIRDWYHTYLKYNWLKWQCIEYQISCIIKDYRYMRTIFLLYIIIFFDIYIFLIIIFFDYYYYYYYTIININIITIINIINKKTNCMSRNWESLFYKQLILCVLEIYCFIRRTETAGWYLLVPQDGVMDAEFEVSKNNVENDIITKVQLLF